jgi:transposase
MSALTSIFCDIDDFCKGFEPVFEEHRLAQTARTATQRRRKPRLALSEIMTILVHFHRTSYRTFKHYYTRHVMTQLRSHFPGLVAYNRFIELVPRTLVPLSCYLHSRRGRATGIAFIDSTPLSVCRNQRIQQHKVFKGVAQRGKTSMGWFYGFKLHLIVNDQGELLAFRLTAGNVDDRKPVAEMVRQVRDLFGKLFGDRGYIAKWLHDELWHEGVELVTRLRKNMKNHLVPLFDKVMLRKRALIETINDQLKNVSQIEHTRHRSVVNFAVNLVAGLVAYVHQPKKPSLNLSSQERQLLPALAA